ncbi:MAG: serine/threonine protein kinase [Sandaracinaceae bacterium]|nr:serine/threonine protein kinase [Sandaracinaceae bacterium]
MKRPLRSDPLIERLRSESASAVAQGRRRRRLRIVMFFVVASISLGGGGWLALSRVRVIMDRSLGDTLCALRDASAHGLSVWLRSQERAATAAAGAPGIRPHVLAYLSAEDDARADAAAQLTSRLEFLTSGDAFTSWALTDARGRIVAERRTGLSRGEPPHALDRAVLAARSGTARAGFPFVTADGERQLMVAAPITAEDGSVRGVLLFGLRPSSFDEALEGSRVGRSGETYAFDGDGTMLNESRFQDDLRAVGRLSANESSANGLRLTQPGGASLTRMASAAIDGDDGVDVDGYLDYRGVEVVGAWTWFEDRGFGVASEVDATEAFASIDTLEQIFGGLVAALTFAMLGLLVVTVVVERLRRDAEEGARVGPYELVERLGEGGMGVVYRAEHALLKRPTAVKLLHPENMGEGAVARFEREVRKTAELTHPNTIVIYDYGCTADGVLFYAMELLAGADLDRVVFLTGAFPSGRVVSVLVQACGALSEAHAAGLVHRDIKPANIYLCRCGGVFDRVKVLDFGLVKATEGDDKTLTQEGALMGTPAFMPPEMVAGGGSAATPASDIYALGAVAYYMLTGDLVFDAPTIAELCVAHLKQTPRRPSERLDTPIDPDLEEIVLQCLAKDPLDRPTSMQVLAEMLLATESAGAWTESMAAEWWRGHEAALRVGEGEAAPEPVVEDDGSTPSE